MTKRVVLIGHPVAHSLSGAMQQAAFDSAGIDAKYELWDRSPMALADAIAGLVASGQTTIGRPGSAAVSYPGFFDDLERVRA